MGGLYASIRKVQEAIHTVIALDNQMTNIRMVTGASTQQAEEYLKTYEQIAEQTSSTTLEVARSAEEWLRQGRSIQETNALIKTSSVFAKVAFLDSAEAATLLTSAINGYGLSAEQAMGIVDKLSAVDVNAATGADDLARALRQTASSAKIAGVGMDDLLGYIATVSDVTQKSADSIGNSFKTIFARIKRRFYIYSSQYKVICIDNPNKCWKLLKLIKLQHKDEIYLSVNVTKVEKIDWIEYG